jgi:hypothetical protein
MTFAQDSSNFVVLKANNLGQIETVANGVIRIVGSYPNYKVVYDQALASDFRVFESQTGPYLELSGLLAASVGFVIVFAISFVAVRRRGWEAGLLMSQGWSWREVSRYFEYYFAIIAFVSFLAGAGISYLLAGQIHFSYVVYGNTLNIAVTPAFIYVLSGLFMAIIASQLGSTVSLLGLKKKGLDDMLREH